MGRQLRKSIWIKQYGPEVRGSQERQQEHTWDLNRGKATQGNSKKNQRRDASEET